MAHRITAMPDLALHNCSDSVYMGTVTVPQPCTTNVTLQNRHHPSAGPLSLLA